MRPFPFIVSLVVVIVSLTTCTKSDACPVSWPPAVMLANGDDYMPYSGPDGGLFPRAIPSAMNAGVMVPLPTAGGFLDFVQTMILGFVAYLLRRSPPPPKK